MVSHFAAVIHIPLTRVTPLASTAVSFLRRVEAEKEDMVVATQEAGMLTPRLIEVAPQEAGLLFPRLSEA